MNVSGNKSISINQLTDLMSEASGIELKPVFGVKDSTDGSRRYGDNQLIKQLFDWQPSVNISEGLKKTFDWMNRG